ncbi:MAG: cytochrome [Rhizobacter sp.]|nr:cytochrome [Rhizobacter sp.]
MKNMIPTTVRALGLTHSAARIAMAALIAFMGAAGVTTTAQAQNAKAGEAKAAICIGCHGIPEYRASFPEIHQVPMLAGQGAKYITAALTEYKKGERKHPTMRSIASSLSDQDMADIAAFYEQQGKGEEPAPAKAEAPSPAVAALLQRGNCISCHGDNFSKPIDASYPKLAGQHSDYLYVALRAYQTDNNPIIGRSNAIMKGMVKPFSHTELKSIADYIGSLPGEIKTVAQGRFR